MQILIIVFTFIVIVVVNKYSVYLFICITPLIYSTRLGKKIRQRRSKINELIRIEIPIIFFACSNILNQIWKKVNQDFKFKLEFFENYF
jgi:hypothetical protein